MSRKERKVVTVVFADLVGFTSRSESLDPEDVHAILSPYHERLRRELERHGGTVEKFIGDAVMAVFGAPVVHEDDAERAVRAALAIRDWAVEDGGVEVRIAVNTGEALVSVDARPDLGEAMVAGDVVNTAARLQSAAPVNGILVGYATHRLTERAIDFRDAEPVEAKGKAEPVPVWEAIGARARVGVELAASTVALVGRVRELDLLTGSLARVREESAPQLLTLVGVPGIGKSRLVRELYEVVADDPELITWRQGRSLPYGEGVTYWALAEMVKAEAGILESDATADVEAKLARAVAATVPDDEARWVEGHLRPLVGLGDDGEGGRDTRTEAFAAWRRFFEALGDRGPVVLVFEDLHWADDGLLDFVDHLVEWAAGIPLLVVCTARPELLGRRPGWGGGKLNATTVSLPPLSPEETARLVHALLDRALLPAETQAALLERAGGNPLYAEEFARIAAARGLGDGQLPLPESVQGLIAARIDALAPEEKLAIEHAAVVGRVFWPGAVAALGGADAAAVDGTLHALARKEFIQRDRRSSVAGEHEYGFRHGLVREVAYGQIPRARRADLHRSMARWIETLGRADDYAELLAHHYLSALEYARAAGQDDAALAERARLALREAGDRAAALNAFAPAERFYRAALELWPDADPGRLAIMIELGRAGLHAGSESAQATLETAREGLLALGRTEEAAEAQVVLAEVTWGRGETDAARVLIEDASRLVADAGPSPAKALALSHVARYAMLASDFDEALQVGAEALALATELGLEEIRADALATMGSARVDESDSLDELEESIVLFDRLGSVNLLRGYNNLAHRLIERGELERARAVDERALAGAQRFGSVEWTRWIREKHAQLAYVAGDWDEVVRIVDSELAGTAGTSHYLDNSFRVLRALIRLARGELEGVRDDALGQLEAARHVGEPQMLHPILAQTAYTLLVLGDRERADTLVGELLELVAARRGLRSYYWWSFAAAAVDLGRGEELVAVADPLAANVWAEAATAFARGDLERAAGIYAAMGARAPEAATRQRLAEQQFAAGDRAAGAAELERAMVFWRLVGATAYLDEALELAS